ncbi:unnamed protein product [Spirodela intermedia]|uniref:CCHC-type domain-containing protein n=1 Tax=Spirodela intermedia TaxID=51605 RepID=A0A7I8KYW1_SPIIN|nr:unnamed protein product [Spirodela intermedia]
MRSSPGWHADVDSRDPGGYQLCALHPRARARRAHRRSFRPTLCIFQIPPLDYDPSKDLLGLEVDLQPRKVISGPPKLRSWFGPNGQYIRELPCPTCRGRGYTPCTECGIERSRVDCSECDGKGLKTCQKCLGDCVIWEESIDERPWEKARSSSPLKVKEDDDVDNLEIEVNVARKSKRVYQSPSPEVGLKISRSLKSLNAKTGLFSKRMRIIHRNPTLHAQRVAAIKKTKGTPEARKQASEAMKAYFRNPENRQKRSMSMKGVKYFCSHCGEEGHRRHYCPSLDDGSGKRQFKCRICGERGHNRRTCRRNVSSDGSSLKTESSEHRCSVCGQVGHNRRTCLSAQSTPSKVTLNLISDNMRTYSCRMCLRKGHNSRTCLHKSEPNSG